MRSPPPCPTIQGIWRSPVTPRMRGFFIVGLEFDRPLLFHDVCCATVRGDTTLSILDSRRETIGCTSVLHKNNSERRMTVVQTGMRNRWRIAVLIYSMTNAVIFGAG